jgi:glucosyl-dolichyl phosphate glucuronosyltransferase
MTEILQAFPPRFPPPFPPSGGPSAERPSDPRRRRPAGRSLAYGPLIARLCFACVRVSHVIATRGRPEPLREALASSIADIPPDSEIIVVDGDPDHSARAVVEDARREAGATAIDYIEGPSGLPRQRNRGIDAARGELVVFTDDDCILRPGIFAALASAPADPAIVGATGRVVEPRDRRIGSDDESRLRWLVLGGGRQGTMTSFGFRRPIVDVERPRDVQYMPGALMSARRSVAADVRFDEVLSGYALGEDDDFSYRLSRRGRIRYVPDAVVDHLALGTRTMDRRVQDRLVIVNRTYLYRKNFSGTLRGRVGFGALIGVIFAHRVLNREWRGVRGLLDGLREVRRTDLGRPGPR